MKEIIVFKDGARIDAPVPSAAQSALAPIPVVVAAPPGPFREALNVLLRSFPNLNLLFQSAQPTAVEAVLQEQGPAVLLIDGDALPTELGDLLAVAKTAGPCNRSIVLITHWSQAVKAEKLGADVVLLKGFRASELRDLMHHLWSDPRHLAERGTENEPS